MPQPVLAKSIASPSSVAHVIAQKYQFSMPLYRQEQEWKSIGIALSRATLANWVIRSAEDWLMPLVDCMHAELLNQPVIHADETPVQVLNEKGRKNKTKSYMWVYTNGELEKDKLEAFFVWLEGIQPKVLPKSALGKAVNYALNHRKGLSVFLTDGNIALSNNICERAIRNFTIGRKNWLFSASPKGASASAAVYSIVETSKANDLEPFRYLTYLLEKLPNINFKIHPEVLKDFLPWSKEVQQKCK